MTYIKINDQTIPATIAGKTQDQNWNNRESKSITVSMTYEEAKALFVDDVPWAIVYQEDGYVDETGETITPEPVVYDNSDYCVAGPITDNRNGTVSVKMGKLTDIEILRKQLEEANAGSGPSQGSTSDTVTEEELAEAYTKGVNSI